MAQEIITDEFIFREIYPYFEYASLSVAILYFNKYKGLPYYKFFLVYLINLILFQILAETLFINDSGNLFNFYTFFEFNFFSLIYFHLIKEKNSLKIFKILVITFNLVYFISFYFTELNKYNVSLEGLVNSIFIILFFRELLNSERILNYKKLLSFWISVGFLLFYLASIPFFTLFYSNFFSSRVMFPILYSLIIVFHLCFIYGIITCRKTEA